MVVFYHLIYDLDNLGGYRIESTSGFWALFADVSASAFVFLAGVSLAISYARTNTVPRSDRELFGKYLRRGLRILSYGMLITLVFWVLQFGIVIFGILHLIGVSIVLAYPFLRMRLLNLFLGLYLIAIGVYIQMADIRVSGAAGVLLAPLFGVVPEGLFMPDYRPLLPWFGVVLLGLFFGNFVYGNRREKAPVAEGPTFAAPIAFLGRHTLFIYLVHQPVLIVSLEALGLINIGIL